MKANDPIFEGTTTLELWRHDDEEEGGCHIGLYYRSNGERDIYEMRLGDNVIPLHPDFPLGFQMAAHCLMHICQDLYSGELRGKESKDGVLMNDLSDLMNRWRLEHDGDDRESDSEGEVSQG